jgi:hypothetical protein
MVKWVGLFLVGFVAIFTGLLFATGVAQKHLIPVVKMQMAASRSKPAAAPAGAEAAPADSAAVAARPAAPQKAAVARALPQPRTAEQLKSDGALAKIYAEMKPEDAARILKQLDDVTAMAIVARMKADKAARLLEAFGPERSVRITQLWASMAGSSEGASQ